MSNSVQQSKAKPNRLSAQRRRWTRGAAVAAIALVAAACASPEERAEKYYQSGQEYLELEQWGRASVEFQNVLKIDETHVPSLIGLATIAEEKRNYKRMFGLYQRIVRLQPDNAFGHIQLGKLYLLGSDETASMDHADKALAIDPSNNDAKTLKAGVLLRLGDSVTAVQLAEEVLADDPSNTEAAVVMATDFVQNGERDRALAQLDEALSLNEKSAVLQLLRIRLLAEMDRSEDVLSSYAALVDDFPEEPAYRRAYAQELLQRNLLAEAKEQFEAIVELEPENLAAKLDMVRYVFANDGIAAAEETLRGYINAEPDNSELKFSLVEFYIEKKDHESARGVLDALTNDDDQGVVFRAKNKIAAILLVDGDREGAEALINEILAADESNTDALIKRAGLQIDDGEYDDAIANLRTALNNDPEAAEAMMLMGAAFERQGNVDFARTELSKGFEMSGKSENMANYFAKFLVRHDDVQRAEDVLVQSLAVNPGNMENLQMLAAVRLQQQDWRGAEEVAQIIDAINAEGEEGGKVARNIRTLAFGGQGQYGQIIDMLSAENDKAPLESRPLATLVGAYLRSQRAQEAETLLENVLQSHPDNYPARILMAQVKVAKGDSEGVEQTLIEATETDPSQAAGFEMLYRFYIGIGQPEKAAALIDSALALMPDNQALQIYKADVHLRSGEREQALRIYAELLDKRPNDKVVMNNFVSLSGELYDDPVRIARALDVARKLENETNPSVQDTVGWAYYRAGEYDRAVEFLSKAASGDGDNAEILYHFGAAQIAAGELQEGRESLNKALEAGGEDFRFEPEIRALLERG